MKFIELIGKLRRSHTHITKRLTKKTSFPFRKNVLLALGAELLVPKPISDVAEEKFQLVRGNFYESVSPNFSPQPYKVVRGEFHQVDAYALTDALVNPYLTRVAKKNSILLSPFAITNQGRFKFAQSRFIWSDGNTHGRLRAGHEYIPKAISVGVDGSFNWYHFFIEFLPKVYLVKTCLQGFDDVPLLVPDVCKGGTFAEALSLVWEDRPKILLSRTQAAHVGRAVVLDEVSFGPFNMQPGLWPKVDDYAQHDDVMREFVNYFRGRVLAGTPASAAERRIFLARPATRRSYNQDELLEIARGSGFEEIYLEKYNLREQAEILSQASHVVGGSGAAWVGMIFRSDPMRGLSWLPREYSEFSSYSSLAKLLGHDLQFIEASPERPLLSTSDAYTMKYHVDPLLFEQALNAMMRVTKP